MAEFISRESAYDVLNKLARDNFTLLESFSFYLGALHDVADGIKNIPTAGVVPVVKCKDCKSNNRCMLQEFVRDNAVEPITGDWFCADGERRATNETD